jgi:hypothetical protein
MLFPLQFRQKKMFMRWSINRQPTFFCVSVKLRVPGLKTNCCLMSDTFLWKFNIT